MRVHGGALPASPTHISLARRQALHTPEKARLAQAAARLIRRGQVVIVDGGSTHLALVAALPADLRCTIVTHSPGIAAALEPFAGIEVQLLGGRINRHSMVAMGVATVQGFVSVRADLCLMGTTGIHPDTGVTTGDPEEAALKRCMMQAAAETVVLATPDKIGATSPWVIAPLSGLSGLVTTGDRPIWLPPEVPHHLA